MKILMLGWELPPHNSGGLGVACYQLCQALSKQNVDIKFVVPHSGHTPVDFMDIVPTSSNLASDTVLYSSYDVSNISHNGSWPSEEFMDQHEHYARTVSEIVQNTDIDIIHAHDWLTLKAGARAKLLSGKPLIAHVHSVESDRAAGNYGNPYVREIERLGLMQADKIIAVSEHTRRIISKDYDIPLDKIEVVHNSIDVNMLEPRSNDNVYTYLQVMQQQGYKVVSSISRLTVQKGLTNLLQAAAKVIEKQPKTFFLIVGSGEQYTELIELAAQLGISKNVLFTGFLRGQKWRDAFSIADLFVMPSVSEPFGLTPLEAAAYGAPSLISKQSGIAEVFNNALKVDFWDIDEMANQIVSVLQHDSFQETLSQNAEEELTGHSWENSAIKLKNLYEHHKGIAV